MKTMVKLVGVIAALAVIGLMTGCATNSGGGDSAACKIHVFTISKTDFDAAVTYGTPIAYFTTMALTEQQANAEYEKLIANPTKIKDISKANNLSMTNLNIGFLYNVPDTLVSTSEKGAVIGKVQLSGFVLWGNDVGGKPIPNSNPAANYPANTYIIVSIMKE